jgi:glycoprotein-N-acetylgalactosamine 3-beta-galactosyltransferase
VAKNQVQNLQEIVESFNRSGNTAERKTKNVLKYTRDDIVCGIITTGKYHHTRAKAVKETWGKRCGTTLFFSAQPDNYLQPVVLPGK